MPEVRIHDLLTNAPVDPDAHLDAERVTAYARDVDALPPVVVFATDDGLLLADGYHRAAAARRAGRTTINAEIRTGTRGEALRYAATVGARQRGVSIEQALASIERRPDAASRPRGTPGTPRRTRG